MIRIELRKYHFVLRYVNTLWKDRDKLIAHFGGSAAQLGVEMSGTADLSRPWRWLGKAQPGWMQRCIPTMSDCEKKEMIMQLLSAVWVTSNHPQIKL